MLLKGAKVLRASKNVVKRQNNCCNNIYFLPLRLGIFRHLPNDTSNSNRVTIIILIYDCTETSNYSYRTTMNILIY